MGLFEDIETELGVEGYPTIHLLADNEEVNVDLCSGPIAALADVRALLPTPLDHDEADIALTNGQSISMYGLEAENTVVMLIEQTIESVEHLWCHAFKYANLTDYNTGLGLQNPPSELRV
jgi:hypothetical protein